MVTYARTEKQAIGSCRSSSSPSSPFMGAVAAAGLVLGLGQVGEDRQHAPSEQLGRP